MNTNDELLISIDTAAQIKAVLECSYAINCPTPFMRADDFYITRTFRKEGKVNAEFEKALKGYRSQMLDGAIPRWAQELFLDRYGVDISDKD